MAMVLAYRSDKGLQWGRSDSPSGRTNPARASGSRPFSLPLTPMPTLLDECPPARLDCAPALDDATAGVWHLLFTKGQREKRLARDLYRLGADFFFPMSERVKRDAYRHRNVFIVPLFPNYLFLRGGADDIGRALATQHIIRVIPVVNQKKLRKDLLNMETAIRLDPRIEQAVEYVKGQRVEVVEGPFEGLRGIIIERGKDTLLQIEVESVGKAVMEIDRSKVQPI